MEVSHGETNGRFWKRPDFSIEDVVKILAFLIPSITIGAFMLWNLIQIRQAIPTLATKEWVETVLIQGNAAHAQFDERIDVLEGHAWTPYPPMRTPEQMFHSVRQEGP